MYHRRIDGGRFRETLNLPVLRREAVDGLVPLTRIM
jgi:hypothetical protein